MDDVGIVAEDMDGANAFFTGLGLTLEGRAILRYTPGFSPRRRSWPHGLAPTAPGSIACAA